MKAKDLISLEEAMSFDRLLRMSEPKRLVRSRTVKGPPLSIDAYADSVYWAFNFKSNPSTTGNRHHGYIKFLKPSSPRALEKVDCMVDCTCPDYRFRWAWANKQHGSGRVGPGTMNQSFNRAPRITNPTGSPGLCKHILALRDYIYGNLSSFPATDRAEDSSKLLNKLVKYADKRWLASPEDSAAARERERLSAMTRLARNRGQDLPQLPPNAPASMELVDDPADTELPAPPTGSTPTLSPDDSAQVGRPSSAARAWMGPHAPPEPVEPAPEPGQPIPVVTGRRRPRQRPHESVVNHNMNLLEAKRTVEELVGDLSVNSAGPMGQLGSPDGEAEPQSAALDLLREIRDLLSQMVGTDEETPAEDEVPPELPDEAPEAEAPEEGGEGGEFEDDQEPE